MQGCGHCHEFVPRLKNVLNYISGAPKVFVGDISKDVTAQRWAALWKVSGTPTTVAISSSGKRKKVVGSVGDAEIRELFNFAR